MNEVTTKQNALTQGNQLAAWGKREIRSTSVIIPRILKMEPMSDLVAQGKAKVGDFVDSLSNEVLGSLDKPFEIVPIEVDEKWAVFTVTETKGKIKREFSEMVPVTKDNEHWKYKEEGIERDRTIDLYCLMVNDFKSLPKDWKERGLKPLPKILSFRRTSLRAGKQIYTQMFVVNESKGLPPPAMTFAISGHLVDGDDGKYGVIDAAPEQKALPEWVDVAFHWFKAIKSGQAKAQEEEAPVRSGSVVGETDAAPAFDPNEEIPF